MKILGRIPTCKYGYVEIESECSQDNKEKNILETIDLVNKYSTIDESQQSLEVVLDGKNCPRCGAQQIEQIGISSKTKKPYHYVKCINNKGDNPLCDYISWIPVSHIK